ncbi:hypothetical protein H0X32_04055 [Patescibacteria group bacterium]|nr:hypothetical protein [Patescibacteria group bacterium]
MRPPHTLLFLYAVITAWNHYLTKKQIIIEEVTQKIMKTINQIANLKNRPIALGVITVFAVILLGASIAFAAGFANPLKTFADDFGGDVPCDCGGIPIDIPPIDIGGDIPCDCGGLPPIDVPPIDVGGDVPCDCGNLPPEVPPVDVPPVDVPPVIPPVIPPFAQCISLTGTPQNIQPGAAVTITWRTLNATSIYITGIGFVTPVPGGSAVVHPIHDTTYVATVRGVGGTVNCQTVVHVTTPPPPVLPQCVSLTGSPANIKSGEAFTLTWKTLRANSIYINNGIGFVTPVAGGSIVEHPTHDTTYIATVKNAAGSVNCQTSVHITTPPPPVLPQCVSLTGTPHTIRSGDAFTIAWKTLNATSITLNNGIGRVTPVAAGSIVEHPTHDTTYIATVANAAGSVNCQTSVVVTTTPPPPVPECIQLTASATVINPGDAVTLSWVTSHANSLFIDNGIGSVSPVANGSIVVHPNGNTTYHATVPGAAINPNCSVSVVIQTPQVCTYNCGGGGGYFPPPPPPYIPPAPPTAAYISLSQIPYTGLDLGPVGTVVYWVALIVFCASAAYLTLFNLVPFLYRRLHLFGAGVSQVINQPSAVMPLASYAAAAAPVLTASAYPVESPLSPSYTVPAPVKSYSSAQGFSSFAQGSALTIDDIVKGLAREAGVSPDAPAVAAYTAAANAEAARNTQVVMSEARPATTSAASPQQSTNAPISTDVRDFIASLLQGDRDVVFGSIRQIVREGGNAETFLTQVVCGLDDAYRARLDGTKVNAEIATLTEKCATPFLERLTAALTNAVDSSYSPGISGAKLAVTRALGIIEG